MKNLISVNNIELKDFEGIYKLFRDYKEKYKNGETKFTDLRGYSILLPFLKAQQEQEHHLNLQARY